MLLAIRDKVTGWLAYIIIILISIPFALWGITEYFGVGGEETVATVDDAEITQREFDRAYARYRAQINAIYGGRPPELLTNDAVLKEQVLQQMIERELLAQVTAREGYRIGDEQLGEMIRGMDDFQVDGRFDKATYEGQLRSQGWTPAGFEYEYRLARRIDQLQEGLLASAVASRRAARLVEELRRQEREIAYLRLDLDARPGGEPPTEAQVAEYYESHPDEFVEPERVRIAYLALDQQALAAEADVGEGALRAAYEEQAPLHTRPEEREARHILITVDAEADPAEWEAARERIEALRERVLAGEDFAELAREHSEDPGSAPEGGDLGPVTRGLMVEPFEEALFALSEGELSEPVRTRFGWHVIRLDAVRPESRKSFEEMRPDLEADLRRRAAESVFYDRVEQLANLTYENPDSLVIAAEALGLPVEESDWFTRSGGAGVAASAKVRAAAFGPEVLGRGVNSDVIELDEGGVVVLRVLEHRPAERKPLAAVRDEIVRILERQEKERSLRALGERVEQALRGGADPAALAEEHQAAYRDLGFVRRDQGGDAREIVSLAFTLRPPEGERPTVAGTVLPDGDYAVVMLETVRAGEATPAETDPAVAQRRRAAAQAEYRAVTADYLQRAEVKRGDLGEEE